MKIKDNQNNWNLPFSKDIFFGEEKISNDFPSKAILGKGIISFLAKDFIDAFKDIDLDVIQNKCFGSTIESEDNGSSLSTLLGSSVSGNKIEFDTLFTLHIPLELQKEEEEEEKEFILNIEAQNKFNPGYDLYNRATIYAARMLSNQKFDSTNDLYKNIKKVYSVWLIFNSPKKYRNTCTSIHHCASLIEGNEVFNFEPNHEIIFIFFDISDKNEQYKNSKFASIKLLGEIFSLKRSEEKIDYIKTFFPDFSENIQGGIQTMYSYESAVKEIYAEKMDEMSKQYLAKIEDISRESENRKIKIESLEKRIKELEEANRAKTVEPHKSAGI